MDLRRPDRSRCLELRSPHPDAKLAREAADASARKRKAADGGEAGAAADADAAAPVPEEAVMGDAPSAPAPHVGGGEEVNPNPSIAGCCSDSVSVELSMGGDYYHACCGDADLDLHAPEGPKAPYVGDKPTVAMAVAALLRRLPAARAPATALIAARPISDSTAALTIETSVPFTSHIVDPPSRDVTTTPAELLHREYKVPCRAANYEIQGSAKESSSTNRPIIVPLKQTLQERVVKTESCHLCGDGHTTVGIINADMIIFCNQDAFAETAAKDSDVIQDMVNAGFNFLAVLGLIICTASFGINLVIREVI